MKKISVDEVYDLLETEINKLTDEINDMQLQAFNHKRLLSLSEEFRIDSNRELKEKYDKAWKYIDNDNVGEYDFLEDESNLLSSIIAKRIDVSAFRYDHKYSDEENKWVPYSIPIKETVVISFNDICSNNGDFKVNYVKNTLESKEAMSLFDNNLSLSIINNPEYYTTITCKDCGKKFYISKVHLNWYEYRGLSAPKRCSSCRKNKFIISTIEY